MGRAFVLALLAALNPTLLAAATVMLLLNNPGRLMLGYLLGAMMTSVTLGLVIVFSLQDSSVVSDTQNTVNPAVDIALGVIALVVARALLPRRTDQPRPEPAKAKPPPRWQTKLSQSTPRGAFAVGAVLTLPGASYLAGLRQIHSLNHPDPVTVLLVVAFNLVMLMLIELPLLGFAVAPEWTKREVTQAKRLLARHGRRVATYALAMLGSALVIKGIIALVAG
ncbi:MAG: GAP family protein [Solirubrobacteraceae bacterium]